MTGRRDARAITAVVTALLVNALAACGAGNAGYNVNDANPGGDAAGCGVALTVDPPFPVINDHVRVTANVVGGGAVLGYAWRLDGAVITTYEAADHSSIGFDALTAVSHFVTVDVTPNNGCSEGMQTITIGNPMGQLANYRLRVVPDPALAPPQEFGIQVHGGQSFDRPVLIDPGAEVLGQVLNGVTPTPAYLRFSPLVGPAFDTVTSTGNFDVHLPLEINSVLVIPASSTLAPRAIAWMPGGTSTFAVDAGTAVVGTVVGRTGAPLANAKIELESGGVPSTVATTAGNGTYLVRTAFPSGMPVTVTVTPPAGSGLARLTATAMFDVSQAVDVSYVGSPLTCDLAGTSVQRSAANQGGASVTIVGALGGTIGSVSTGTTTALATGTVHVATIANGGGTLASTIVPRSAALSAVVELSPGDLAVAALDTSTCAAATIDAPAMIVKNGTTRDPTQAAISGVHVDATPVGALAMASLIPVQAISGAAGAFSLTLASGGHYELRFYDHAGRGAPLVFGDVTAAGVPLVDDLAKALAITGLVGVIGDANPIENASVQILCTACSGVAASRPVAQTATDITSHYRVAVPDPGM